MKEKPLRIQPSYALIYAAIIPDLQAIAKKHGYALAVHGSMATDLDLVAIPWIDGAGEPERMVIEIAEYIGADHLRPGLKNPGPKPHGRMVWTLIFDPLRFGGWKCPTGPYIDLSIMPRVNP